MIAYLQVDGLRFVVVRRGETGGVLRKVFVV